jgi:protein SCO1/2
MILTFLLACGPSTPAGPSLRLDDLGEVPEFSLRDQTDVAVTRADLVGQVWLADFMFTSCPDICPTLSARMASVAAKYVDQPTVRFVSFSVDPETDTPHQLDVYGARFGAVHPTWRFLTGETTEMKKVVVGGMKQLMDRSPGNATAPETVLHGSRFVLVDKKARIRAYADPKVPGELEAYLDLLLAEP